MHLDCNFDLVEVDVALGIVAVLGCLLAKDLYEHKLDLL